MELAPSPFLIHGYAGSEWIRDQTPRGVVIGQSERGEKAENGKPRPFGISSVYGDSGYKKLAYFQLLFRLKLIIGSMRILVVEDEHKIAAAIKKGLEQERYAVDVAYSGIDGFDLASTEEYDAILLDLLLPGMDGISVCRQLRKKEIHTPVLMLTA